MFREHRPKPQQILGDGRYLLRSVIFLLVLLGLGALVWGPLVDGFMANPILNGTILGILVFGVAYTFRCLTQAYVDSRAATRATTLADEVHAGKRPLTQANEVLLSTGQSGLGEFFQTVHRILHHGETSATLPYLLDSVATRGEDRRALVRYLTGALVLLGLIGTFYGLLVTIGGVREVLGSLSAEPGADTLALLTDLRERLAVPLKGMGIAFSSSLFGLLASLVLAFLELQLFHAQNNLQTRLEILVVSDLVPLWGAAGTPVSTGPEPPATPRYLNALLEATADRLDRAASLLESQGSHDGGVGRLSEQVAGLSQHLDSLRETLEALERDRTADLRHELRLMTRALAQDKNPHASET
ncbi:MAG: hypothetical protein GWN84_01405 [Gammaproteobacteria bacterium]|nr:hypothetical protein [Gammaproteobacteria bacterium]NIR81817.1 hypothetical protein [Gammaproteobacteria bacterium]NIR88649.1 hypothetical protein [Gammaproteobacteria bacterium]NIU02925.1 hypothetical protein [Gammaproteobacteria bacterium]NIV50446.1 hypothetical protein [Gammaproteobacteria bacterium]